MFGSSPTRQSPGHNARYTSSAPDSVRPRFTRKALVPQFSGSSLTLNGKNILAYKK